MLGAHRTAVACVATLSMVLSACSNGGGDSACGPILREALDPGSFVHILGDEEPEYRSDPPTSGPHFKGEPFDGVYDYQIPRPIQVGELELGYVFLQHQPDLDPDDLERLQALAGPQVVVAPNEDLDAPVVATAWLHKRTCRSVDVDALTEFIDKRRDQGPGEQATG